MENDNICLKCGCEIKLSKPEKLINYGAVLKHCPKCQNIFFTRD